MRSLTALRKEARRTQDDAAEIIGRTQQFVSACELGLRRMNPRDEVRLRAALEAVTAERQFAKTLKQIGRDTLGL